MEQWWSDTDREKAEVGGEKPAPLPFCYSKLLHVLAQDRTGVLRGERLNHGAAFENWLLCYIWDCLEGF